MSVKEIKRKKSARMGKRLTVTLIFLMLTIFCVSCGTRLPEAGDYAETDSASGSAHRTVSALILLLHRGVHNGERTGKKVKYKFYLKNFMDGDASLTGRFIEPNNDKGQYTTGEFTVSKSFRDEKKCEGMTGIEIMYGRYKKGKYSLKELEEELEVAERGCALVWEFESVG